MDDVVFSGLNKVVIHKLNVLTTECLRPVQGPNQTKVTSWREEVITKSYPSLRKYWSFMTFGRVRISILLFFLFGPLVIYGAVDGPIPMHIKAALSGPSGL